MEPPIEDYKGWEPDRGRWTRMYKGVRFRRTPEQLGLPQEDCTAEGSHTTWLAWLRGAVKHFDLTGEIPPPPKKEKTPKRRKSRFVPRRDDPDYPTSLSGTKGGLDQLRQYVTMRNELDGEETRILDELRAESQTDAEYQDYLAMQSDFCGNSLTLDDLRYANKVATEILEIAKTLNEIRQYAKSINKIHETLRPIVGVRQTIHTTEELREYGDSLKRLLQHARRLGGDAPPPSYRGWEGPPRYRWSRMHKGVRYRVTCAELGLPQEQWNAKDSHEAWLKWFSVVQSIERSDADRLV